MPKPLSNPAETLPFASFRVLLALLGLLGALFIVLAYLGLMQISGLKRQLQDQRTQIQTLGTELKTLNTQVLGLAETKAKVDPIAGGYGIVKTDSGALYISIDKVQPYLAGFKIWFKLGNPMNVRYNGFEMKIEYGDKKSKEFTFLDSLPAGYWKQFSIILSPASPGDMKSFLVSIITDRISLFGK